MDGITNLICDKIDVVQYPNEIFNIHVIKNFKIINNNGDLKDFDRVFFIPDFAYYGHMLMDIYAQYKVLKRVYSDLKPVVVSQSRKGLEVQNKKVFNDLLHVLEIDEKDIIDISLHNFSFKELIFIFDVSNLFPQEFYIKNGLKSYPHYLPFCRCYLGYEPCGQSKFFNYNYLAIDELRNDFFKFNSSPKEKIYVSREFFNKKWKSVFEDLSSREILSDSEKDLLRLAPVRLCEYEEDIQELFQKNDYRVVKPEELGLFEQINIFNNASHMAGISGTWLFNCFWSNPGTTVYELWLKNYFYHYDVFGKYCLVNYNKIDFREYQNLDLIISKMDSILKSGAK